jgi:DnaK suppressor protein
VPSAGGGGAADDVRAALVVERTALTASAADLRRELARTIAASESSNADDEHDPEGSTIAFERAQLAALLDRTVLRLAAVDAALERVAVGGYGGCERCGRLIDPERLAARPEATRCIDCARLAAR